MNEVVSDPVDEAGQRAWLALNRAPGIGGRTLRTLLERFPTPTDVLAAGTAAWSAIGLPTEATRYLAAPDWSAVDADLSWLKRPGNHLLTLGDAAYPALLRQLDDAPPVLFVHGEPAVLSLHQLAMVGSRNPTPEGRENAFAFARHLSAAGLVITSGLALGIDAASHRGALADTGLTVAVAGTGLDRVYPASQRELAHAIAERGALVSEFPPGTPPRRTHFPRRNRIISGLSLGTLVVEAAARSGSLITARLATEQGREVFAIPGSIHNPLARGCHGLIRNGAKLVETATDVLEELGPLAHWARPVPPPARADRVESPDPEHAALLEHMGFEPVSIDTLVERSGLTADTVSSMLLVLELHDHVASIPGGRYSRVTKRA